MSTPAAAPAMAGDLTDPIDSLDFSGDAITPIAGQIPEHMMLDGPRPDDPPETSTETDPDQAPESEAPVASPDAALPDGFTRDAKGRVHRPDGTLASKEELEGLTAAPVAAKPEPFRYRFNGKDQEQPGFEYNPTDGTVRVGKEQVGLLRDAMNARHVLSEGRDINARLRQEMAARDAQIASYSKVTDAKVAKYNGAAVHMLSQLESPEWQAEFAADPGRALSYLKREVGLLLKEADLNIPKAQPVQSPAENPAQVEAAARQVLTSSLDELFNSIAEARGLFDQAEQDELYETFNRRIAAYFTDTDDKGEQGIFLDFAALKTDLMREVTRQQKARTVAEQARVQAEKKAKLAAENARRTTPSIDAPPTPGGGSVPAKKAAGKISSKDDLETWWESSEL